MTPFSKVKTWIKQGFYEKLPSSKSLRGALDLQQEILDSLIREEFAVTPDCCNYYPTFPLITDADLDNLPIHALALCYLADTLTIVTKTTTGDLVFTPFGGA